MLKESQGQKYSMGIYRHWPDSDPFYLGLAWGDHSNIVELRIVLIKTSKKGQILAIRRWRRLGVDFLLFQHKGY